MKKATVIFMGTPDFAVPALKSLSKSGHRVALVVTQPDRPKGRGRKPVPPPVKQTAQVLGCKVVQPQTIKDKPFITEIAALKPDVMVVVAFGRILPPELLAVPSKGTVNIHASLLPKYRGPAPIQWAVINGETETGVTTMLMDAGLDTGDILMTTKTPIGPDDTAATLHDRLAKMGADLLIKTLTGLMDNSLKPQKQDHAAACYAPLLKKSDGRIDWQAPAEKIECFVRGMSPWPGAFTFIGSKRIKIFKTEVVDMATTEAPGTVLKRFSNELLVATGHGALSILELQGASGKRLNIIDYLRGNSMEAGIRFE